MRRKRFAPVVAGILLLLPAVVVAQSQTSIPLRAGSTIKSTIAKGQVQNFTFETQDNGCAELIFEWRGIDLRVAVYDPSGKAMLASAVPVAAPGPVSVLLKTEKSQTYRLEVTTPVKQNISGAYEVFLKTTPTLGLADENRLQAQSLVLAARNATLLTDAVEKYQQALALARGAHDVTMEAQIFLLLGNAYRNARDPKLTEQNLKLAEENYKNAVSLWRQSGYKRGEGYANISLGVLCRQDRPTIAITFYVEAALLFEQIGDGRGRADALYGQAFTLMKLGRTSEAVEILLKVLERRRADSDRLGEAITLNALADGYRTAGDLGTALKYFEEATQIAANLDYPLLEAAIINGKALVNDELTHWEDAKADYYKVLTMYERILGTTIPAACNTTPAAENRSTCWSAARLLINVGEVYNSLGKSAEALVEFKKSLTINDVLAEKPDRAESHLHVGYAYFLSGDIASALNHYQEALKLHTETESEKGIAAALTYIGMAYIARGEPKVALEKYQAALPKLEAAGDKRLLAVLLDHLGTNYSLLGNPIEALSTHERALRLWREIKDPDGEALTLHHMAEAERQSGNLAGAIQHSEAAIKKVESLRTRIANEKFRVSYLSDKKGYYETDVDLRMQVGMRKSDDTSIASALQSNEMARARALLDALHDTLLRQAKSNQAANQKLTQLLEQKEDLVHRLGLKARARTELLSGGNNAAKSKALDADIDQLTEKLADLDSQIRAESPRFAELTRPQPATVQEIQQQLDTDTLLLEFALGEKRSYVWAVTTNNVKGYELPARDQIENAATRLLQALTAQKRYQGDETSLQQKTRLLNAEKEYADSAGMLARMVLHPVAERLDHKRLVIVADGALQLIPFAVLPDPKNSATNLINNYEIVTLPSASVLALQRRELANRKPAPLSLAVVADPVFDSDDERVVRLMSGARGSKRKETKPSPPPQTLHAASAPLPDSKADAGLHSALRDVGLNPNTLGRLLKSGEEAAEISSVVSPSESFTAIGFQASRAIVMSGKLARYRNVHFATHGLLDLEHPELSGIVLSRFDEKGQPQDGYLRLYEIYNLNLPADLVVLSACQTGSGKQIRGEGLMALTRGFMYAGAARVVATLWKVDDAATADLMALFYKEMFTNGKRPAAALRDAQIHLSKQKRWSSPYYWSGFVLQGEWR